MADNYKVIDATNAAIDMRSTEVNTVQVPHYIVELASAPIMGRDAAGVAAAALSATPTSIKYGVTVRCMAASPEEVYIGDATVTTLTGYPLYPGNSVFLAVSDLNACYIISASGTGTFAFLGS
jgi:hypothetical protein